MEPTVVITVKEGIVSEVYTEGTPIHYRVIDLDIADLGDEYERIWVGPILESVAVPDLVAEQGRIIKEQKP